MGKKFNRWFYLVITMAMGIAPLMTFAKFEFSPITILLQTTGKNNHVIAQVVNRDNSQVPIMIRVTDRKQLENGEEERADTNDIAVFPSQFILEPKESKSIKVFWQGGEKVDLEKSYRIIVEEVPVEFSAKSADKGAVRIFINYVGSVYVNSEVTDHELVLESVKPDKVNMELSFFNKGKGHGLLRSPKIEITAKSSGNLPEKKYTLDKKDIASFEGKNILAQSRLKFKIPTPKELMGREDIIWTFTYEK